MANECLQQTRCDDYRQAQVKCKPVPQCRASHAQRACWSGAQSLLCCACCFLCTLRLGALTASKQALVVLLKGKARWPYMLELGSPACHESAQQQSGSGAHMAMGCWDGQPGVYRVIRTAFNVSGPPAVLHMYYAGVQIASGLEG